MPHDDLLNDFFETVSYAGDRPSWKSDPSLGDEDDGVPDAPATLSLSDHLLANPARVFHMARPSHVVVEHDGRRWRLVAEYDSQTRTLSEWDESAHPRVPAGASGGGQFASSATTSTGGDSSLSYNDAVSAIKRGEPHLASEDDFVKYHVTGHIASDAYERYEAGDMDYIKRERFNEPIETLTINGETVDVRLEKEEAKYVKLDADDNIVRDERGLAKFLNDEEMRAKRLSPYSYTVGAFVGEKAVGYSGDEFGATGVYVARAYQRHGLGITLLKTYLEKSGRLATGRRLGQMTPAGVTLTRALHRALKNERKRYALRDWNEEAHPRIPAGDPNGGQFAPAGASHGQYGHYDNPIAQFVMEHLGPLAGIGRDTPTQFVSLTTSNRTIRVYTGAPENLVRSVRTRGISGISSKDPLPVLLTREDAETYVRQIEKQTGLNAVTVEIDIPKAQDSLYRDDPPPPRFLDNVPPEWVVGVWDERYVVNLRAEQTGRRVFAVLFVRQEKHAVLLREWQEEDHPRAPAGSSDGGQFTVAGVTSQRPERSDPKTVFADMANFRDRLSEIPTVSRVSVKPGVGAWQGGREATWVVSYRGNGQANKLLAETGKRYDQDAVLIMRAAKRGDPDAAPMAEYTFEHGIGTRQRDAIGEVLAEHGIGGWTWLKSPGGRTMLRAACVPQWGGDREVHLAATKAISARLSALGAAHAYSTHQMHVEVLERDGYDRVINASPTASVKKKES